MSIWFSVANEEAKEKEEEESNEDITLIEAQEDDWDWETKNSPTVPELALQALNSF